MSGENKENEAGLHADRICSKFVIKPCKGMRDSPEVFSTAFSPDDQALACSYADGTIRVFNAKNGNEEFSLNKREDAGLDQQGADPLGLGVALKTPAFPTTQVKWRPATSESKTKNVLISVNAENDGLVQHWHIKSGKCLHKIEEPGNQIFCLDYFHNGTIFATAGRDYKVRIYDEATKRLSQVLEGGDQLKTAGHSNRVFSVKFHSENPNILISAGWDNTVQIWDLRKGQSIRSIYGAYICGDSVDMNHDSTEILTASYRTTDTLQVWDFASGKLKHTIPWRPENHFGSQECMCFLGEYSKPDSRYILAGGSQNNEAKIFDAKSFACVGAISVPKPVFCGNFSNSGNSFAIGGADGQIRVFSMPKTA